MIRGATIAAVAVLVTVACVAQGPARAAGGDDARTSFDTQDGWRIRPFPSVQVLRMGVKRRTASMIENPDFTWDLLQGIGLGISFNPPWRRFRSHVYDSQGRIIDRQWLGFSLVSILRGGSASTDRSMLEGAEVGFGASLDFLEILSLGVGVDLYRGIAVDDRLFHTGLLPRAFGAGHFTGEDVFVSLSINIRTTLFDGSAKAGSDTGAAE